MSRVAWLAVSLAAARGDSVAIGVALASPRDGDCVWREFVAVAELLVDLEEAVVEVVGAGAPKND